MLEEESVQAIVDRMNEEAKANVAENRKQVLANYAKKPSHWNDVQLDMHTTLLALFTEVIRCQLKHNVYHPK